MIMSLLMRATPEEVRLLLIDPKRVEFAKFNGLPHLLCPPVNDPNKAACALAWAAGEAEARLKRFAAVQTRDIDAFNAKAEADEERLPHIVVIIDELVDLMLLAGKETELSIWRIAQLGRRAGVHVIVACTRPRAEILTGTIRENLPVRCALRTPDEMNSRVIIDRPDAASLCSMGDMLFLDENSPELVRAQACFPDYVCIEAVVEAWEAQGAPVYDASLLEALERAGAEEEIEEGSDAGAEDAAEIEVEAEPEAEAEAGSEPEAGQLPDADCGGEAAEEGVQKEEGPEGDGGLSRPLGALLSAVLERMETAPARISTGLADMDRLLNGGFAPGHLIGLAGEQDAVNSAFAGTLALNAAKAGNRVLYFDLTGDRETTAARLLALEAGIPLPDPTKASLDSECRQRAADAAKTLENLDIHIGDRLGADIRTIREEAQRVMADAACGRGIVFVDNVQLVFAKTKDAQNRTDMLNGIVGQLGVLARDLRLPVVAIIRCRRPYNIQADWRGLDLSGLRRVGISEQHLDAIAILDVSLDGREASKMGRPALDEAWLTVARHREGSCGETFLGFDRDTMAFSDKQGI